MQLLILLPILSQLFYVTKLERISHEILANYTCIGSFQSKLAANFNAVAYIIEYFESTHLCDQTREDFPWVSCLLYMSWLIPIQVSWTPMQLLILLNIFESTHPNYTCIGSFQSKLAANLMQLLILLPILSQLFYVTKL